MNKISYYLMTPSNCTLISTMYCFLRIGIGVVTIGHGLPKLMGGPAGWQLLGSTGEVIGVHHFFVVWGLGAACIQFFGGVAITLGLATRVASFFLTSMMTISLIMHNQKGDPFTLYSFSLSLLLIFGTFMIVGGGPLSIDNWLYATIRTYVDKQSNQVTTLRNNDE